MRLVGVDYRMDRPFTQEHSLVWNALRDALKGESADWPGVSVLYVDLLGFSKHDQQVGSVNAEHTLRRFHQLFIEFVHADFSNLSPIPLHIWDDGFAVILKGQDEVGQEAWGIKLVTNLEAALNEHLNMGSPGLQLRCGYAHYGKPFAAKTAVDLIHGLLTKAGRAARRAKAVPPRGASLALQSVLASRRVETLYQPIVDFQTQRTIGWEGLTRGPAGTPVHSPGALFDCAEKMEVLFELETICRHSAIHHAVGVDDALLFLNVNPRTFLDLSFREGETHKLAIDSGLRPEQIVFEITEHQAVDDFQLFQRVLNHYRRQGYKIAIDDTGAGYSGLVTLMEVKPDYVKIDMALIRDIHQSRTKQDIVKAIQTVSHGLDATVIAEGIETIEEYEAVKACGVSCGQGYLFGRPNGHITPALFPYANYIDPKSSVRMVGGAMAQ